MERPLCRSFEQLPAWVGLDAQSFVFLAWALPLAAWLAQRTLTARPRAERRGVVLGRGQPA